MSFLSIFYQVLLSPSHVFHSIATRAVNKDHLMLYGILLVALISALGMLYVPWTTTADGLIFQMVMGALGGLLSWLFTGVVFSSAAYVFGFRGRPMTLLILSAFATMPWLLLPVVMLFRDVLGSFGNIVAITGALFIWLWATVLFVLALKHTYELTLDRMLLAVGLPFLMMFIGISWFVGFFINLAQFLSA